MKMPSAQPPPRVPRSRRDDRFERAEPMPPKLAGIGVVVSTEYDTVTVLIDDEELSGVIPIYQMPAVGDIVEVESRRDLLVIPMYIDASAFPALADWYFDPDESPGWEEGDDETGEHVQHQDPTGPGILWNSAVFNVNPDDRLTFTMRVDKQPGSENATVQVVFNWAAVNAAPSPGNGEVVGYGPTVLVDTDDVELTASATVPDTFTKPNGKQLTTGATRLGLLYTPAGG